MQIYLETERLILRRLTDADVENLFVLDSDPAVMRFINGGKPAPREVIETETLPRLALVDKGFSELGAQRIFATSMTVNAASRRVMAKVGLKYVRTFHESWPETIEGTEEGDVEYALTRSEWEQRSSS
jgi:RimJ/RimL family protein N-acetyltransferase